MYKGFRITRGEIVTHQNLCLDTEHLIGLFVKKDVCTKKIKKAVKTFVESSKHINKDSFLIFDREKKIKYKEIV